MSVNKYLPHVFVVPEDRANEEIAAGFVLHDQVKTRQIQILPCADGWPGALEQLRLEIIPYLHNHKHGYFVLAIDFDGDYHDRRQKFNAAVPPELRDRVFVIGARENPEQLKREVRLTYEEIGIALADDCFRETLETWAHDHLQHNEPDRERLAAAVRSIVFGP
jgi:hypothetical protein